MQPEIERLVHSLQRDWNKTVLFIGSGFSSNEPANLPSWSSFLELLLKEANINNNEVTSIPMLDQAELARKTIKNESRYRQILNKLFGFASAKEKTKYHELLSLLPRTLIITTNYDTIIENTLEEIHGPSNVLTIKDLKFFEPSNDKWRVLKIHGCIKEHNSLVVTRSDYDKAYADPLRVNLLKHIFIYYNVLFLGFSMSDPALDYILGSSTGELRGNDLTSPVPERWVVIKGTHLIENEYRNLNIISGEDYSITEKVLESLTEELSILNPPYRLNRILIEKKFQWCDNLKKDFEILYSLTYDGIAMKEVRRITDRYIIDTFDPVYKLNDFSYQPISTNDVKSMELDANLGTSQNDFIWTVRFTSPLKIGDNFSFTLEFKWSKESPAWEKYRIGTRLPELLSEGFPIKQPTKELIFELTWPEGYCVQNLQALISKSDPPWIENTEKTIEKPKQYTDGELQSEKVSVRFPNPDTGQVYSLWWNLPDHEIT